MQDFISLATVTCWHYYNYYYYYLLSCTNMDVNHTSVCLSLNVLRGNTIALFLSVHLFYGAAFFKYELKIKRDQSGTPWAFLSAEEAKDFSWSSCYVFDKAHFIQWKKKNSGPCQSNPVKPSASESQTTPIPTVFNVLITCHSSGARCSPTLAGWFASEASWKRLTLLSS